MQKKNYKIIIILLNMFLLIPLIFYGSYFLFNFNLPRETWIIISPILLDKFFDLSLLSGGICIVGAIKRKPYMYLSLVNCIAVILSMVQIRDIMHNITTMKYVHLGILMAIISYSVIFCTGYVLINKRKKLTQL
ncbi:hypothetical protein AN639_04000 [Candidatus Epulonipiscium fishelsonii]|uniref:Uncharacterized protein n=1 Tax=Candidatus Epulonipiscium fishelsonii TaxID=77094 RepID=A0ACC8X820_9FIRM|nr:hypothetical protein AN396_11780 [Epulopiscium sp. SCG-B11WGA-EpuloA1]ONI41135.1 hypothetical protein AN639_04000 [Epulopiscium sp. SCG-B05WGA-EpuloA1]ONI47107.1 hypothetical protein AN644_01560 [Epulopiscium sp. SCG-C06WGA-EpuloA1]